MVDKIVPLVKDFLIGFIAGCLEGLSLEDGTHSASRTEEETPRDSELPYFKFEPVDQDEAAGAFGWRSFRHGK